MKFVEKSTGTSCRFGQLEPTDLFRLGRDHQIYMKTEGCETDAGDTRNAHRMRPFANDDPAWLVWISSQARVYPLEGAYIENPCKECLNE